MYLIILNLCFPNTKYVRNVNPTCEKAASSHILKLPSFKTTTWAVPSCEELFKLSEVSPSEELINMQIRYFPCIVFNVSVYRSWKAWYWSLLNKHFSRIFRYRLSPRSVSGVNHSFTWNAFHLSFVRTSLKVWKTQMVYCSLNDQIV